MTADELTHSILPKIEGPWPGDLSQFRAACQVAMRPEIDRLRAELAARDAVIQAAEEALLACRLKLGYVGLRTGPMFEDALAQIATLREETINDHK